MILTTEKDTKKPIALNPAHVVSVQATRYPGFVLVATVNANFLLEGSVQTMTDALNGVEAQPEPTATT